MTEADPVNPQRVVWEMSPLLPADAIVTSDSGSCANWYARDYRVKQGQSGITVRRAGFDGRRRALRGRRQIRPSLASRRRAGRRWRDADEQHGGAHHHSEILGAWPDPRLIVCVFNNEDLNEVTWEQRVMEGNPRYAATQSIPNFPYARFAEMLGFKGIYVDAPGLLRSAWQQALASDPAGRAGGQDRSGRGAVAAARDPGASGAASCRRSRRTIPEAEA